MNAISLRIDLGIVPVILVFVLLCSCACTMDINTKNARKYYHCFGTGNPQYGKYYNIVFDGEASCFVHQQQTVPGERWDVFAHSTNISSELRSVLIRYADRRPKRKPPKSVVPGTRLSTRTRYCKKDESYKDFTVFFQDEFLELEQLIDEEVCKDENIVSSPPRWIIENKYLVKWFGEVLGNPDIHRAKRNISRIE